jgi:uncharacterized OB-fold protein
MTLTAPYVLEYSYKRSVGPVIGRFLAGLREGKIFGVRTKSGRVLVPPAEYDEDGEATGEFVELPPTGTVMTWAWVTAPRAKHPLARPFAWGLIKIDGADTSLLHVVDAPQVKTGMRVRACFRSDPKGDIRDLECFVHE